MREDAGVIDLAALFDLYGTDKARNGYHHTYRELLEDKRRTITAVLEVGIGTLIPSAHSSMVGYGAPYYAPGGSLRAWRDYLPNATIVGVDTQPDTQFSEDRIRTVQADSTDRPALDRVLGDLTFDLIVDDGDHASISQLATLANLWPRLRRVGAYVIEDISSEHDLAYILDRLPTFCHTTVNATGNLMVVQHGI